ncbi:unnamed protein product [Schistosoma margrebowiei]|uniref:Uncharacterized protein n=1 Tax=Schistosoma margrebowiei TaxID=48269 RepID=A0A3P7ZFP1_9TREM|nr:unnamed protein product [Schistosoma margrebowiei]
MRHHESSSNNQLTGTRRYISTKLIMRKRLIVWIGGPYGNLFNTME